MPLKQKIQKIKGKWYAPKYSAAEVAEAISPEVAAEITADVAAAIDFVVKEGQTAATGDILYKDAEGTWTYLPIGTAGQVLKVVAGKPAWAAA